MTSVAHSITGHEQTQLKRVCYFRFNCILFFPNELIFQNLFIKCCNSVPIKPEPGDVHIVFQMS